MSSTPMSKDTNPKTTNIAHVAITSGPAAAAAKIRKNKKKRTSKIHTHPPPPTRLTHHEKP